MLDYIQKKNWFNKNTLLLGVRRLPAISYINFIKYNECLLDKKLGSIQQQTTNLNRLSIYYWSLA